MSQPAVNKTPSAATQAKGEIRHCWVVTDGKAGMENQCVGLAEAVGLPFTVKRIAVRAPWAWLPPRLWLRPLSAISRKGDPLDPPWPDLMIATGRRTVAIAAEIRRRARAAGHALVAVQIQNPNYDMRAFDLVVTPFHDRLEGPNVMATIGALHRVTSERLAAEAASFADRLHRLPKPLVAVLIGGDNKVYRLTKPVLEDLCAKLRQLAEQDGAGLAITPSRRTGAANIALIGTRLRDLIESGRAELWDETGPNPYFAYLGAADAVVATCDSVNMITEAASTGKPVFIHMLQGGSAKFEDFHAAMAGRGAVRPFRGRLERWTYEPVNDTATVAAAVRRLLHEGEAGSE